MQAASRLTSRRAPSLLSRRFCSSSTRNQPKDRGGAWKNIFWALPITCFGLSYWQWKRLDWKKGLIADRETRVSSPITPIPDELLQSPVDEEVMEKWEFRPVTLTGTFLNQREFHVGPRSHDGQSGFHIITPFETKSGKVLLVNRGWVPYNKKEVPARKESIVNGEQTLFGLVRRSGVPTQWTPENNPIGNYWFWLDAKTMAETVQADTDVVIDLEAVSHPTPGEIPVPGQTNLTLPNSHLSYMITWGSLGIALSFMSYFFVKRGMNSARGSYDAFGAHKPKPRFKRPYEHQQ